VPHAGVAHQGEVLEAMPAQVLADAVMDERSVVAPVAQRLAMIIEWHAILAN
jgi:hypothetical protein